MQSSTTVNIYRNIPQPEDDEDEDDDDHDAECGRVEQSGPAFRDHFVMFILFFFECTCKQGLRDRCSGSTVGMFTTYKYDSISFVWRNY